MLLANGFMLDFFLVQKSNSIKSILRTLGIEISRSCTEKHFQSCCKPILRFGTHYYIPISNLDLSDFGLCEAFMEPIVRINLEYRKINIHMYC